MDNKSRKYDRQLRLWGDHGQEALEAARICLINATAAGTETLKNLILPGVGSFQVLDGAKLTGEDVGNNFFFDRESIGKCRAKVTAELLAELNPDVSGDYVEEDVSMILKSNPSFFKSFDVVIASNVPERNLLPLGELLWNFNIPLVVVRAYGLIGYIRIVCKEHPVHDSRPENPLPDLRLDRPFPALVEFIDKLDLSTMPKKEHNHTPFLAIIYKYMEQWKKEHNGQLPLRNKSEFKDLIRSGILIHENGVPELEENFEEAIKNVNIALVPSQMSSEVRTLFEDKNANNLTKESCNFWVTVRAIKEFVENEGEGLLPVRGSIPDMFADTERYVQLQKIYRQKADEDAVAVFQHAERLLRDIGRPKTDLTELTVKHFCRNASFLRVIRCRSLQEEYEPSTASIGDIATYLEMGDNEIIFYVLLRAVDRFFAEFGRYPGYYDDQMEMDISKLKSCLCKLLQEWEINQFNVDDYIQEFCRYGGAELHSIASFVGGCAAQEVIKLITKQFIPLNNTFIFNGIKQTSSTFQL